MADSAADCRTVGAEVRSQEDPPGLGNLPVDCIVIILRLTTPRDVARLACVSKVFRAVADSDSVWEQMLPPSYANIIKWNPRAPPLLQEICKLTDQTDYSDAEECPKKQVYNLLCNTIQMENSTRGHWLDRATGALCLGVGARGLSVSRGSTRHCWDWDRRRLGSRFAEIAYLRLVWWLDVQGTLTSCFPPGTYTLSWRLLILDKFRRTAGRPVRFTLEATGNEPITTEYDFCSQHQRQGQQQRWPVCRSVRNEWTEVDVGEFTVEKMDTPVKLVFAMKETYCGLSKKGLYLDGVVVQASYLMPKAEVNPDGETVGGKST